MALKTITEEVTYSQVNSGEMYLTELTKGDVIKSFNVTQDLIVNGSSGTVAFRLMGYYDEVCRVTFNITKNPTPTVTYEELTLDDTYNVRDISDYNGRILAPVYNSQYYVTAFGDDTFISDYVYTSSGTSRDTSYAIRIMRFNNYWIIPSGRYVYYGTGGKFTRVSLSGGMSSWRGGPCLCDSTRAVITINGNRYKFYSNNGTSWTRVSTTSRTYVDGCMGNGYYVFITSSGYVDYSSNGSSWTAKSIGSGSKWSCIAYGNNKFIALGTNGDLAYTSSITGSWTYKATQLESRTWASVTYNGSLFVAIASNTNIIATSADGITWTEGTLGTTNRNWSRVKYENSHLYAVANSSNVIVRFDVSDNAYLSPSELSVDTNTEYDRSMGIVRSSMSYTANSGNATISVTYDHPTKYYKLESRYVNSETGETIKDPDYIEIEENTPFKYPDIIQTINKGTSSYTFDHASYYGPESGDSLGGNLYRTLYYNKNTIVPQESLLSLSNPGYTSGLINDKKVPYVIVNRIDSTSMNSNTITVAESLTDKIVKLQLHIDSSATSSNIIEIPFKIGSNIITTMYCDIVNGNSSYEIDIQLSNSQSLVVDLIDVLSTLKAAKAIIKVDTFIEPNS